MFVTRRVVGGAARTRHCASAVPPSPASDVITPWDVQAQGPKGIDYTRVISTFKSQPIDAALLQKFSEACSKRRPDQPSQVHHLLRRGITFAHRDADAALDDIIAEKRSYLYTGRGPSASAMHVGHIVPFLLTKHLQEALNLPLVIQLTDDEKFLFRGIPPEKMDQMTTANIKDIIAFGFDVKKTFIFRNTQYMGSLYPTVLELQRLFTCNAVRNTFGFDAEDNVGKYAFAATQAAPCFASAFPKVLPCKTRNVRCLIPCAVDQDPFFVLTRGVAERMKRPKPSLLLTKFMPALKGALHKMSSSAEQNGVILVTDKRDVVRQKMRKAFSGGKGTLAELQEAGADLDADVAFQMLLFLCSDDATVESIRADYSSGRISSGAVKDKASDVVADLLEELQQRRAAVTDDDVARFTSERPLW